MKKKLIIGTSEDDHFLLSHCSKKIQEKLNNIQIEVLVYDDIHPELEADHFYLHCIMIDHDFIGHPQFLALKESGAKVTASVHVKHSEDLHKRIFYFEGKILDFIEKHVTPELVPN